MHDEEGRRLFLVHTAQHTLIAGERGKRVTACGSGPGSQQRTRRSAEDQEHLSTGLGAKRDSMCASGDIARARQTQSCSQERTGQRGGQTMINRSSP